MTPLSPLSTATSTPTRVRTALQPPQPQSITRQPQCTTLQPAGPESAYPPIPTRLPPQPTRTPIRERILKGNPALTLHSKHPLPNP